LKPAFYSTAPVQETAILVAVLKKGDKDETKAREYLDELEFLATTLDIKVLKHFTQKLDHPEHSTYVGKGKLEEMNLYCMENDVDWVIFDDDLSASQVKNINNEIKRNIYDRSLLILSIFERRAQTTQSRTQVELAKNQYMLPRLTNMWTHLERQRGGTGTRGGSGEKEIETDRRVIKARISFLKDQLKEIDKISQTQRKTRTGVVRVAIVGYTNVGKSTLMNLLTKSELLAENKLFATVDSTVRKLTWDNIPFLISDTVGFIRKLPTQLIESFKSTLSEVAEADILIHVVDISHTGFEEQIEVVAKTLGEIKAADKPTIIVFNKIDKYNEQLAAVEQGENDSDRFLDKINALKKTYMGKKTETVFISATQRENIEELRSLILHKVKERYYEIYPNYVEGQVDYTNF
jgi:GTP-binding protein HflX